MAFDPALYVWWIIPAFWWLVGLGSTSFELLPSVSWWIREPNMLWSANFLHDLAPCPFTIVTSIGHIERASGYTRKPLAFSFQVKFGDSPAHLLLMCAVTEVTNYDILVGQQTLYSFGFGLDNWLRRREFDQVGRLEMVVRNLFLSHSRQPLL